MEENRIQPERLCYPDYLRVLAAFAVVLLHTAAQNWTARDVNSSAWLAMNFYDGLTRWGVPVFVMISGAMLAGREIPLKKLFGKYILRMAAAFLFWTVMYALFHHHDGSLTTMAKAMLAGNYHMWYLALAIGLYLSQPLFYRLASDQRVLRYSLLLALVFAFLIPFVMLLLGDFGPAKVKELLPSLQESLDDMNLYPVMGYFGYFLLGHVLATREVGGRTRKLLYGGIPIGLALTIGLNAAYCLKVHSAGGHYFRPIQPHIALTAAGIFLLARRGTRENSRLTPAVKGLSGLTFGIYLVHPLVLNHLELLGLNTLSFNPWLSVPLLALLVFLLSAAFSWLLGKLPLLGKYIV